MIQPIMRDIAFLKQKSLPATRADRQVALDLLDTLKAHESECVGMAANMIGVRKNIIAVNMGFMNVAMFNPVIVKKSGATLEGAGIVIEKGFQQGGQQIRDMGVRLESLAIIDSMTDDSLTFRE